jgi:hypothetical protein
MFYVRSWDTDEVLSGPHKTLPTARRYCRGEGHTSEDNGKWFLPVAYVANEVGECVYNPRFSTRISGAIAGAFQAHDDHLR